MYHQGTFPDWRSPPPAPVFHRWPVAPPGPLSPQPDPLPSQPDLLPLTHLPPSAPPPNVGVDLFGAILLLVCVVNTLFTVIILYYTLRSLCHRRVTPPIPGRHYPAVSVLVPCYLPNEQGIIMGTIAHILRRVDYPAPLTLYIVYNSPTDLPAIEADLAALEPIHFEGGRRVCVLRASDSRSKAENLNLVLGMVLDEFVSVCDPNP